MLTDKERALLQLLDADQLEKDLSVIADYDRLSGSCGEKQAADYICEELGSAGIENCMQQYSALLSNPVTARLEYWQGNKRLDIPCKTRSFSGVSYPDEAIGELIYVPASDLASSITDYFLMRNKRSCEYEGKIVLSETANPVAVLDAQRRGAKGYIHWWKNGKENLIHEGIFNPVWGTPMPEDISLYPEIPVVAVDYDNGSMLHDKASCGNNVLVFTVLEKRVESIPLVVAEIPPANGSEEYLMIGSHLDSWFKGATDNATGNVLALTLARILSRHREQLRFGVKFAWWSGHSNGRYAGSSIYAKKNFLSLLTKCLAYMNIDMPGMRGATDYSRLASGMELFDLAKQSVNDLTGQQGLFCGPVRGWDQSFQNIGVTPYFVWASTLPDGHPDLTGNSFMSWWWHTEQDTKEFYDPAVMRQDAQLYLLAAFRLLNGKNHPFRISSLLSQTRTELNAMQAGLQGVTDISECMDAFSETFDLVTRREVDGALPLRQSMYVVKKINQLLYAEKGPYLQDWAAEQQFFPGLRAGKLLNRCSLDETDELVLNHFLQCQENRILAIFEDIKFSLK